MSLPNEPAKGIRKSVNRKSDGLNSAAVGFIGCGNMTQALLTGFLKNGLIDPKYTYVSAPSNRNLQKLGPLGIMTTHDNTAVVENSDIIFLSVKPDIIPEVLAGLTETSTFCQREPSPLFVSVAPGISIAELERMLTLVVSLPRVLRIIPNTPCMVGEGCFALCRGSNVSQEEGNVIKSLLQPLGLCEEILEKHFAAFNAVAGSGPAYMYSVIESLSDGAVKMGLPRALSMKVAAQMMKGAATMVLETEKHPGQLKDEVCSPGGTTIAGMHALEKGGLRNLMMSAIEAATQRALNMG